MIQSLKRHYEIIYVTYADKAYQSSICREEKDTSSKRYQVICIRNKEVISEHIQLFLAMKEDEAFKDFEEVFLKDQLLYVVFAYKEAITLKHCIETEEIKINEQGVALMHSILEALILHGIPNNLVYDVLSEDNVCLDLAQDVVFHYNLGEMAHRGQASSEKTIERILGWMDHLLPKHISEVKKVKEAIESQNTIDLIKIYKIWSQHERKIYDEVQKKESEAKAYYEQWMNQSVRILDWLKKLLGILILSLIIGYLIYSTFISPPAQEAQDPIEQIGNVVIQE